MIKSILKFSLLGLLAIAVNGIPIVLHAQNASTNSVTTNKPPVNPSRRPLPFHGKVRAIDPGGMTITVSARTFQITSETKITKDGKPALLTDGTVGDNVSGSVKRDAQGKWNAVKINFGKVVKRGISNPTTNAPNTP